MFWNRKKAEEGESQLSGPKGVPQLVGAHMVVEEKQDPDVVWNLKAVVHPTEKKKAFYCRVFSEAQLAKAGVKVKDWNSLNDHGDLILWEGYFDNETNAVRRQKFEKASGPSN